MRALMIAATLAFTPLYAALAEPLSGQQPSGDQKALYATILHMDSVMFDAFNSHDLEVMKNLFAPNCEFYHDRDGLQNYETTIKNLKGLFASNANVKRELIPASVQVYAIPGFGAVELGDHKFVNVENGQSHTTVYHFIHTWQFKDNQWKVTRAISLGH